MSARDTRLWSVPHLHMPWPAATRLSRWIPVQHVLPSWSANVCLDFQIVKLIFHESSVAVVLFKLEMSKPWLKLMPRI